jgi:CBS domain-containing protein
LFGCSTSRLVPKFTIDSHFPSVATGALRYVKSRHLKLRFVHPQSERRASMRAGDIMTRNVVSVSPETPASRAVALCLTQGTSGLPVVDRDHRIVGFIGQGNLIRGSRESTERRVLWLHLLAEGMARRDQLVQADDVTTGQIMNPEFVSTSETAPIEEVAQLLVEDDLYLLPVVHESRLVGIIGRSDVLDAFIRMAKTGMKQPR